MAIGCRLTSNTHAYRGKSESPPRVFLALRRMWPATCFYGLRISIKELDMSDKQSKGNLADSIAMLEQILEVMPQDIEVLKALYNAYLNGGHMDRAFEYLNQLIEAAMGGDDAETLLYIGQELPNFEESNPSEVAAQIARLRTLASLEPGTVPKNATKADGEGAMAAAKTEIDISEELALAWRLYEEHQLSQEE